MPVAVIGNLFVQRLDEFRRSGRGPTRAISLRSTLINCGNSSSRKRRIHFPAGVIRGSSFCGPYGPGPRFRVRIHRAEFITVNVDPFNPTRTWR